MILQQLRSAAFFVSNLVTGSIYLFIAWRWHGQALFADATAPRAWALAILVYIPVQVVTRLAVFLAVLAAYKLRGGQDDPSLEDEMDKAIDARMTRVLLNVVLLGLLAGLGAVAAGLPTYWLFVGIGAGIWLGAVVGDALMLIMYRRGL